MQREKQKMTDSSVELKDLNPDIDPRLMETPLPNVLALQKGLGGDELSNPEIYLREFLNSSHYFRQLSSGDEYRKPDKEHPGYGEAERRKLGHFARNDPVRYGRCAAIG